jgi:hypothetical protein
MAFKCCELTEEQLIALRTEAEKCECDFDCYCEKNVAWAEQQLELLAEQKRRMLQ